MNKNILCNLGGHDWEAIPASQVYVEGLIFSDYICLRCGKFGEGSASRYWKQLQRTQDRKRKAQEMAQALGVTDETDR